MPIPNFEFETLSAAGFEGLVVDMPADEKWELIGGRFVREKLGVSWEHKRIVQNLSFALMAQLRAGHSPCRPYNETFWLKDEALELQVLPDVMVSCGALEPGATHLSDPAVIAEVLAPGRSVRDLHGKWALYQQLPSLKHYAIAACDRAHVEVSSRGETEWSGFKALQGLDASLNLPAIGFAVPLAEIYRDVLSEV